MDRKMFATVLFCAPLGGLAALGLAASAIAFLPGQSEPNPGAYVMDLPHTILIDDWALSAITSAFEPATGAQPAVAEQVEAAPLETASGEHAPMATAAPAEPELAAAIDADAQPALVQAAPEAPADELSGLAAAAGSLEAPVRSMIDRLSNGGSPLSTLRGIAGGIQGGN